MTSPLGWVDFGYKYLYHNGMKNTRKARGLLERSRMPVSEIGWAVGYRDAAAFSRVFRAVTGHTAGDYRKRFGVQTRTSLDRKLSS